MVLPFPHWELTQNQITEVMFETVIGTNNPGYGTFILGGIACFVDFS